MTQMMKTDKATLTPKEGVICYPCAHGRHGECYRVSRYHGVCQCAECNQEVKK